MYKIEKKDYGFHIILDGLIREPEAKRFAVDVEAAQLATQECYSSITDIRSLVPPTPEVVSILGKAMRRAKEIGLKRMAIVMTSPIIKGQAIQLGFSSDSVDIIRYFDASRTPDWEKMSLDWVVKGVEPVYA